MKQEATPNLRRRLRQIVGSSLGVALFLSIASSILMLGIPIYSMQLFDRAECRAERPTKHCTGCATRLGSGSAHTRMQEPT